MGNQSMDRELNLGGYSIKRPADSSDIRVGSFWKRHQSTSSREDSPPSKRLLIADNSSSRSNNHPKGSIATSQSTSRDSDQSQHRDEASTNNESTHNDRLRALEERLNRRSAAPEMISRPATEQTSSEDKSSTLYIDTQQVSSPTKGAQESIEISDDTHESVVIDLNPAMFEQDSSNSTQIYTQNLSSFMPSIPITSIKQKTKKTYPKQMHYDKIMSNVIFVMSGYENPRRSKLRDLALEMGAKYQPSWNRFCTHLICAFKNTPKYKEVMAENGRIVREHWIQECSRQRQLLDWRNFKLGIYPYPDSEEEVDVDDLDYALQTGYGVKQQATKQLDHD